MTAKKSMPDVKSLLGKRTASHNVSENEEPSSNQISNMINELRRQYDENSKGLQNDYLPQIESLDKYDYSEVCRKIIELDRIDYNTLNELDLMDTINGNSLIPSDVIEKQSILSALLYRQSQIDDNDPILDDVTLSFVSRNNPIERDIHQFEANVILKLERNENPFRQIEIGTELIIMEKDNEEETGSTLVSSARILSVEDTLLTIQYHVVETTEENIDVVLVNLQNIRNKPVIVYEIRDNFIHKSVSRAIEVMASGSFDYLIKPEFDKMISEPNENFSSLLEILQSTYSIDFEQARAIYNVCTRRHFDLPYVIYGLYGSPQLRLITTITQLLIEMKSEFRILLLSPSNWGVDQLANDLAKSFREGLLTKINVLRLRSNGSEPSLDFELSVNDSENKLEKYRVVISTLCACSKMINSGIKRGFYSHIFIHEASLIDDGNFWIPISGLANHKTSIVMTGDPFELNPIIKLNIPLKITSKFQSTLRRYIGIYESVAENSHLISQLKTSDQLQDSILKMIGEVFFEHPEFFKSIISNTNENLFPLMPNKEFPVIFVNVNGDESQSHGSKSFSNNEQAEVVVDYIKQLLKFGTKVDKIGVVSGYRDQTILVEELLKKERIPNYNAIKIGGMEQFDGADKNVIIFTTVRTEHLGSMCCQLRLYTAITRAKDFLIIIGNENALNGDKMRSCRFDRLVESDYKYWTRLISYCRHRSSFINWSGIVPLFNYVEQTVPFQVKNRVLDSNKRTLSNDLTNICNDYDDMEILLTDDEMPDDNRKLFDDDEISSIELDDEEPLPTNFIKTDLNTSDQTSEAKKGIKRKVSNLSQ